MSLNLEKESTAKIDINSDLKPLIDFERDLIKRVTYYTSLFIASLGVIIITVLIDGSKVDFSLCVKIIFTLYLVSILVMVAIGNIIWEKINENILRYQTQVLVIDAVYQNLTQADADYYRLLGSKKDSDNLGLDTSDLQVLISTQKKAIEENSQTLEGLKNKLMSNSIHNEWYARIINWNVFISAGLLAIGIICIVAEV
jgi:hypothetical protein